MQYWRFNFKFRIKTLWTIIFLGLLGCTFEGGIDQPAIRKFTWFSYIAADDIQHHCREAKGDRYRFVYNGVYTEQVRSYDILPADKGRYKIVINVTEKAQLSLISLDIDDPNLFQPWHPKSSETNISAADVGILQKTLKNAGFFDSPPPSENLPSIGFYWVVSACIGGNFTQNAYLWPDKNFKQAQFGKLLSAWDFTDIPVNSPRETSDFSIYGTTDSEEYFNRFDLRFGRNGLIRHTTIN